MPATPETTGRYLVLLCKDKPREGVKRLAQLAEVRVQHTRRRVRPPALAEGCALVFDHIGVALLQCTDRVHRVLADSVADGDTAILAVEPERTVHAFSESEREAYLRGYRDAVEDLTRRLLPGEPAPSGRIAEDTTVSWGVRAVGADGTALTGQDIRIAVLDTGLDLEHPDFQGRTIVSRSFIEGETAQDANGHGTHCAGIAAGPAVRAEGPRYGVAGEAELYIGKVLSDSGSGADGSVLQGIDWAIENGCHIVSMSLGSPVEPGQSYSTVFEAVAQRALEAGTLIVAAAGNESQRPQYIAPVGHPANCPSVLAVAAVDSALKVAPFSCGGLQADGGEVNLAAPGVDILSAWPMPQEYRSISGTSMATPFVAGVAALYAEADPAARAGVLAERLVQHAHALAEPARDVGAGLVHAAGAVPTGDVTPADGRKIVTQPWPASA